MKLFEGSKVEWIKGFLRSRYCARCFNELFFPETSQQWSNIYYSYFFNDNFEIQRSNFYLSCVIPLNSTPEIYFLLLTFYFTKNTFSIFMYLFMLMSTYFKMLDSAEYRYGINFYSITAVPVLFQSAVPVSSSLPLIGSQVVLSVAVTAGQSHV